MNINNILVLGSDSQIAKEIFNISNKKKYLKFIFCNKNEIDIRKTKEIERVIKKKNINILINCAAFTNVDLAEKYKKKCLTINFYSIKKLAKLCKEKNIVLIHFSSDYVFDGKIKDFYNETSKTNPINYYGYSKLMADKAILKIEPRGIIIRTSWVYSQYGKNFVKTIMRLIKTKNDIRVVNDQFGSPTSAKDIAQILLKIICSKKFKTITNKISIFNLSGNIKVSWYNFAKEILKYSKTHNIIRPIPTIEYHYKTLRPFNSSLECSKIQNLFPIKIPKWQNSLKKCIESLNSS